MINKQMKEKWDHRYDTFCSETCAKVYLDFTEVVLHYNFRTIVSRELFLGGETISHKSKCSKHYVKFHHFLQLGTLVPLAYRNPLLLLLLLDSTGDDATAVWFSLFIEFIIIYRRLLV